VRRKPGALVPLEVAILEVAATRRVPFHGFELARALADAGGSRSLTSHGTLYKALARLAEQGLLVAEWEDPERALREGRPRRRLYELTAAGAQRELDERRAVRSPTPGLGIA
jgi:PadR family transcriptional regulator, regulatory protein PadR